LLRLSTSVKVTFRWFPLSAAPVGSALPFELRASNVVESSVPWGEQPRPGYVGDDPPYLWWLGL
jgi:hypothetical protein